MAQPLRVLISGSGIAGSVFAFCLLRAFPTAFITIVERAPSLRLTGASVDIRSSAVDIIKWMGLEEEIRRHTTNELGVRFVRADGSEVARLEATGRTDMQSFTSEFEIFRGELARIFVEPVLEKVTVVYGEAVESFEESEEEVVVTFENGRRMESFDFCCGW